MRFDVKHGAGAAVSACCHSAAPKSLQRRCQIASAAVTIQTCIDTGYLLSQPTSEWGSLHTCSLVYMFVLMCGAFYERECAMLVFMVQS